MISRKSSSQLSIASSTATTTSSPSRRESSPASSPATSSLAAWDDCCGTDAIKMSHSDDTLSHSPTSRPLTVAIPNVRNVQGPFCPRRPNLREILADASEPPWSLAAFMAYLSNNHCLETLEFTMDAGRYRKHYSKMMSRASPATEGVPPSKDRAYVQALWQRLVDAYIQPNGSREVNLPSDVRDPILRLRPVPVEGAGEVSPDNAPMPPPPEALDPAVAKIYELMEESVLVPFLNSVYPQTAHPAMSAPTTHGFATSDENLPATARTYDDRSNFSGRGRGHRFARSSPPRPPHAPAGEHTSSYGSSHSSSSVPSSSNRKSAPSALTNSLNKARFSSKLSPTTSAPSSHHGHGVSPSLATTMESGGLGPGMTPDDSGTSTGSPTHDSPMTPPMSPPSSSSAMAGLEGSSPKRDSGMWKKLGRLSGMKVGRKKSQAGLKGEEYQ